MSRCQTSNDVTDAALLVRYVTITSRLVSVSSEDYMKLARLAYEFRRAVLYATRMLSRNMDTNAILRELRGMMNKAYGDSAYKVAKTLIEGCKYNGCDSRRIKIRRLFIVSEGEASRQGNRNVRFESARMVRVKYPYNRSWLLFEARFGEKYLPLVEELVALAKRKETSYGARIVLRNGKVYLHLSIPVELYLRHSSKGRANGNLVAGFDLNSDRINMAIVDKYGRLRDVRTEWFPEVTSHGYPRSRARARRLEALARLLRYAYHHGVGVVVFENLLAIKRRRYTRSRSANRKITRFAKRELLRHGVIMAMKYGFKVLLVDPRGTSSSEEHKHVMGRYGLDRHAASAYLVALKGTERYEPVQKAIT